MRKSGWAVAAAGLGSLVLLLTACGGVVVVIVVVSGGYLELDPGSRRSALE